MGGYLPYKEGQYADYLSIHCHLHTQWSVGNTKQAGGEIVQNSLGMIMILIA